MEHPVMQLSANPQTGGMKRGQATPKLRSDQSELAEGRPQSRARRVPPAERDTDAPTAACTEKKRIPAVSSRGRDLNND